jgi:hypothetical protein
VSIIRKKKKTTVRRPKHADEQFTGPEPRENVTVTNSMDSEYRQGLFWYAYYYDVDQAKKWLVEYMKKQKHPDVSIINSIPQARVITTVGYMAKLMLRGWQLPADSMKYFADKIEEMKQYGRKEEVEEKSEGNVVDLQARVQAKARELRGKLDVHLDAYAEDVMYQFSMYDFLTNEQPSPVALNLINNYVSALISELEDGEGFEHISRAKRKKWLEFHNALLQDVERYQLNKKITRNARKPRKVKEKPVTKLVEKMKYMKESAALKLVSINPADIVKAQSLWVYNTKYRQLTVYTAASEAGLSVKGTTIQNFDETTSMMKRLRKPEVILPQVLEGGKVTLRRLMDSIKTSPSIPKGRINEEILLLRVTK